MPPAVVRCRIAVLLLGLVLASCGGPFRTRSETDVRRRDDRRDDRAQAIPVVGPAGTTVRLSVAAILHLETRRAYIARPEHGVEALDFVTGETHWVSDDADRPLTASAGLLVAQEATPRAPAAVFRVAFLAARRRGEVLVRSEPRDLPDWVPGHPWNNGATYEFHSDGRIEGGRALVTWRAQSRSYPAGAPDGRGGGANRSAAGRLRIDPRTGDVEELEVPAEDPSQAPEPSAALGPVLARLWSKHLPFSFRLDERELVGIVRETRGDRDVLVLGRWDARTARELSSATISPDGYDEEQNTGAVPIFSADGRHVLVSRLEGRRPRFHYEHSIHDVQTGRRVGFFVYDGPNPYPDPILVVRRRLLYVERTGPLYDRDNRARLVGVDLADGSIVWSKPLRQVHGHGLPPSAAPGRP